MNKILLVSFLIVWSQCLFSQGLKIADHMSPISTVDRIDLPKMDNKKLVAKTRAAKESRQPKRFAEPIMVELNTKTRGTWESVPGDRMIWRMVVSSQNAYSLNMAFSNFYLPPSGVMFLYDSEKTYAIGPLTDLNNKTHKEWWSPIIPFDEVVIEIQVNKDEAKDLTMNLTQVNHDFSGFGALMSGSCNVDVVCGAEDGFPMIDEYRDIMNSVGMYSINGIELCTGSLINSARNDCTPYFLTAFHCDVSNNNAASVVIYWNYENSVCRTPNSSASGSRGDGLKNKFNSGTQFIAGYDASDFTLLLLEDDVNADYNPFYAGWDADGEIFDSTLTIHHPNSEEKRISMDFGSTEPYADEVFQRIDGWEIGTTEGGSSGAPLFDKNKRIIGQLNGGLAACGNSDFDDFGMIKVSWEGGGTPSTRLKDWLDPDKTGILQMDGRSCRDVVDISPDEVSFCVKDNPIALINLDIISGLENGATVELLGLPSGISASLSSNQITNLVGVKITLDGSGLTESYTGLLGVKVSDEFTSNISYVRLSIDADNPIVPTPISPANNTSDINFNVSFSWSATGLTYQLQVSKTSTFAIKDVDVKDLTANNHRVTSLAANTTYFWRVKALNECGQSDFGPIYSFSTGNIVCQPMTSTDGPIVILEQANKVVSSITIENDAEIADINILNVKGTHTWISDLEFRLIGPNGVKVDLLLNGCDDEENFNVSFDDESNNINLDCPFLGGKAYRPVQKLSIFEGKSSKGKWTLEITDDVFLDGGSFESWTLELCLIESKSNSRNVSVSPQSIEICENLFDPIDINLQLSGDYDPEVKVSLISALDSSILGETISVLSNTPIVLSLVDIETFLEGATAVIVRIEDSKGPVYFTIPISFIVNNIATSLLMPANQQIDVDRTPTFTWSTGSGSAMTTVHLFDGQNILIWDTTFVTGKSVKVPFKLEQLTQYYWNVETIGECSPAVTSETFGFITQMTTSTQEIIDAGINIFPNPTQNQATITKDGTWTQNAQIRVLSPDGHLVRAISLNQTRQKLDLSGLGEGLYFYEIVDGDRNYIHKLIIVR